MDLSGAVKASRKGKKEMVMSSKYIVCFLCIVRNFKALVDNVHDMCYINNVSC